MTQEQRDAVRAHFFTAPARLANKAKRLRPKCDACSKWPKETGERFCHSCLNRLDNIDYDSESQTELRRDMARMGVTTYHKI